MYDEPCFVLIDKYERVIKKDDNGMLCIFDTENDADKYFRNLHRSDKDCSEVVKKSAIKR